MFYDMGIKIIYPGSRSHTIIGALKRYGSKLSYDELKAKTGFKQKPFIQAICQLPPAIHKDGEYVELNGYNLIISTTPCLSRAIRRVGNNKHNKKHTRIFAEM